jgi:monoterpene epsilon-lactone hydrolase
MSHDFALCLPELQESIDSLKEIRDFVNRIDRAK